MSVRKGLKSVSDSSPGFSNNNVSNLINSCLVGFANSSYQLAVVIDKNSILTASQKTDIKTTINNIPFANIGRLLRDLDIHTENLLNGSLGEETVAGSGDRGDFLEHMQLVDSVESQLKNLQGITASDINKGVDDHFGTLGITTIESRMRSISINVSAINTASLASETTYSTACTNLINFINAVAGDSTDFQQTLNTFASAVATAGTNFNSAVASEPYLTYKTAIVKAQDIVDQQIVKEANNLGTLRTYSKSLIQTQSYVNLAQNSKLKDLISKSSNNTSWKDYFTSYDTRQTQFDPLLVSANDSSDDSVVENKLRLKGLPDVTNHLDLKRVVNKAKRDVRLTSQPFSNKTTEQIIELACQTLKLQTAGLSLYQQSKNLLDNMNKNDIDIIKQELLDSQDSNTLS